MTESVASAFERGLAAGDDPYPCYRRARAEQPVFYSDRLDMWFVTRYDDVRQVLRDPITFSSQDRTIKPKSWPPRVAVVMARRRHAEHVGNADPPVHTRLRRALNETFTPARISRYEDAIESIADDLLARLGDPPAELLSSFCYPFALTAILTIIGVPLDDLDDCMRWARLKSAIDFAAGTLSDSEQLAAAHASVEFIAYCDDLVHRRHIDASDDLVSRLLHENSGGGRLSTEREVADVLPLLIFAGHETTANLLGNLLWILLRSGTLHETVAHPNLLDAAVEETLRYDSPALGFVRRTTRDVTLADTLIPAGAKVFLLFGSADHDETQWAEPEIFDPRRNSRGHLAFGFGIHYCVGAGLARLETRVGLRKLVAAKPALRLSDPSAEPDRATHLVLRTHRTLPVAW